MHRSTYRIRKNKTLETFQLLRPRKTGITTLIRNLGGWNVSRTCGRIWLRTLPTNGCCSPSGSATAVLTSYEQFSRIYLLFRKDITDRLFT